METAEIQFYELLKKHNFNSEDAEKFVGLQKEMQTQHLATKEDLREAKTELTTEIVNVKTELTAEIANVKAELTAEIANVKLEIANVKAELTTEIAEVKAELTMSIAQAKTAITWRVFIFWLAQIGVLLGIAYKVFSV